MHPDQPHTRSDEKKQLDELKSLVADCLKDVHRQGATGAEVGVSVDTGLSVTARLGEVETVEHHRSQGFGLTVYMGQRKGTASTSDLSQEAMRETVAAACRIARHAAEDPFAGLPDENMLATEIPDLDLYHPWMIAPEAAIDLVVSCESSARHFNPEIVNSEGAGLHTFQGFRVLGNSLGFLHGYATSRHSLSVSVIGERDGEMQRDDWWTAARKADDLQSPREVGVMAAERTLRRLGASSLSSRTCPVIFSSDVAGSLIGNFIGAIRGGNLYRKSSFLLNHLGKAIFPDFVQIHEQPHIPRALGSAPHDAEGVRTRAHPIVRDGILESYVLSSYSARRLGMQTTGNAGGIHNLIVEPGQLDQAALLKKMGTGLLITELMGQGVNLVTGDYSRGAAGFWVEGGVLQYPVEEITIAGNLRDIFKRVVAFGNDVDTRGNIRIGSVLVEAMTIAGR